jgi:Fanconi anemia group M protein
MIRSLKEVNPGQKTLDVFKSEEGIVVLADNREAGSKVVTELKKTVDIRLIQLEVGDYIVSDRVGIERKSAQDFVSSIIDKRLFDQVAELMKHFDKPILIIEGTDIYSKRAIHPNAIRGALASLAVDFGVPILFSQDAADTASIIEIIARREQLSKQRYPSIRGKKKSISLREQQLQLVASLPNISLTLAERLLEHFKTPENLFTASENELSKVEKIGKVKSETIKKVVTSEFE